jgi:tRNA threonylcarbamoyladenosine biosynthesis protein TsaB
LILRRILTLDATMGRASVALLEDERLRARRMADGPHGIADALPALVRSCLDEAEVPAQALNAIAVTIGPGSFTGLRASIALAQGLGLAAGVPVHGITLTEAFAEPAAGRALWIAVTARRGRVFLEREGHAASHAEDELPAPSGPIAIAGDQAIPVAARLAAAGFDILLTASRYPEPAVIARMLRSRLDAGLPPRPAVPAYVDPPEAKLPRGGLRPPPGPAAPAD